MNRSNGEKILSTIVETYFLGKIIKTSQELADFLIMESNHSCYDLTNPYLSTLINKVNGISNIIKDLSRLQTIQSYETESYRMSQVADDEWVIWLKPKYEKELAKVQADLVCQKSLVQLFIDSIPDVIFYKDINGTYVTCNQAYADLIGKDKNDIIGRTDKDVEIIELEKNRCRDFDQEVIDSETRIQVQEKVYLSNGQVKKIELIKVPFGDEENTFLGIVGISRDISDKIKSEVELKQNEERFRKVFESISDAIILVQEDKILEVNRAYEEIFDESVACAYEYDSIQRIIDKLSLEDLEKSKKEYKSDEWTYKGRLSRANQQEKWIQIKYTPMDKEKKMGILVIGDITSKRLKDRELESLRDEFFSNLSHEFKTPINLIHSALDLLRLNLIEQRIWSEDYEKYFRICGQNTARLLKLTNNLIDVTKIESGHFQYYPKMCNIVHILDEIVESVAHYCEQKGMSILFDPHEEEIDTYCDIVLIERIVLNLISNAIKYSQGTQILINMHSENEDVVVTVIDNGIGIPEDKLESIFERFTRINNRFTKRAEGSGLGLYLVKALAEVHGGMVSVKSRLGEGAKFTIILPKCSQDKEVTNSNTYTNLNDIREKIAFELCDLNE